jgi:hypothetical protein
MFRLKGFPHTIFDSSTTKIFHFGITVIMRDSGIILVQVTSWLNALKAVMEAPLVLIATYLAISSGVITPGHPASVVNPMLDNH